MMMRTSCLIIVMLFLFCFDPSYSAAFADTATRQDSASFMSPWIAVELDVNKPEVIEIVNFAVTEHNKRSNSYLKLSKIIYCTKLYLSLFIASYTFELLTQDGVDIDRYLGRVLLEDSYFNRSYQLQNFELIPPPI
ncbi:hypothetical protein PIB30_098129 [Stylosanthes scabra]|uniref:Cystatin domain-containing protein n=1 Tax=Stylosanthes scabra TaxID=79078 RepID=A0ABU6UVC5_9FABA|nr:hypothetical protein [Stylosanthes scabra]